MVVYFVAGIRFGSQPTLSLTREHDYLVHFTKPIRVAVSVVATNNYRISLSAVAASDYIVIAFGALSQTGLILAIGFRHGITEGVSPFLTVFT